MSSGLLRVLPDASIRGTCSHWLHRSLHVSASSSSGADLPASKPRSKGKTLSDLSKGLPPSEKKTESKRGKKKVEGESVAADSKVLCHLAEIENTKGNLVLYDIERYKPKIVFNPKYTTYDDKYKEIHQVLINSFTAPQFRQFLELYRLPLPPHRARTKDILAEKIMEKWGWEPLKKVQEDRLDKSETSHRSEYSRSA